MSVARNSQTNSNGLVVIDDPVFTPYGVTISDIGAQKNADEDESVSIRV